MLQDSDSSPHFTVFFPCLLAAYEMWNAAKLHDDTMTSWMTTHDDTLACQWRQMMTLLTEVRIMQLFKNKKKTTLLNIFLKNSTLVRSIQTWKEVLIKKKTSHFFSPRARRRGRQRSFSLFLDLFLGCFLGREHVFLSGFFFLWTCACFFVDVCMFSWMSMCFLVFLFSFLVLWNNTIVLAIFSFSFFIDQSCQSSKSLIIFFYFLILIWNFAWN